MSPKHADEIAALILAEMIGAAAVDGVTFDDEQLAFIEQALSDAAQEAINRCHVEVEPHV